MSTRLNGGEDEEEAVKQLVKVTLCQIISLRATELALSSNPLRYLEVF